MGGRECWDFFYQSLVILCQDFHSCIELLLWRLFKTVYLNAVHIYFPFQDLHDLLGNLSQVWEKNKVPFSTNRAAGINSMTCRSQFGWKFSNKTIASFHVISFFSLYKWHCLALSVLPRPQFLAPALRSARTQNWDEKKDGWITNSATSLLKQVVRSIHRFVWSLGNSYKT